MKISQENCDYFMEQFQPLATSEILQIMFHKLKMTFLLNLKKSFQVGGENESTRGGSFVSGNYLSNSRLNMMIARSAVKKVRSKSFEFKLNERIFTKYRLPFNVKTIDFLHRIKNHTLMQIQMKRLGQTWSNLSRGSLVMYENGRRKLSLSTFCNLNEFDTASLFIIYC